MGEWFEVEPGGLALATNDLVVGLTATDGHVRTRDVAQAEHQIAEPLLDFGKLALARGDPISELTHLGAFAFTFFGARFAEFSGLAGAPRAQFIQFVLQPPAIRVYCNHTIDLGGIDARLSQFRLYEIWPFTNEPDVQHFRKRPSIVRASAHGQCR